MTELFGSVAVCWWDIPALAALAAATAWFFVTSHKLKKEKKELEGQR